ncbi:MAG: bacillithiol system redox-active protein YtxJ [Gemmatimonadota bacterium]
MPILSLKSEAHYDETVASELPAIVFKHSPSCGVSHLALRVIRNFVGAHPEVPVLVVDVIDQRELSETIAERLGIRHESPQSIVVRAGHAMSSASHSRITMESVADGVAAAAAEL